MAGCTHPDRGHYCRECHALTCETCPCWCDVGTIAALVAAFGYEWVRAEVETHAPAPVPAAPADGAVSVFDCHHRRARQVMIDRETREQAAKLSCHYCKAEPGAACTTAGGRRSARPHAFRLIYARHVLACQRAGISWDR